MFELVAKSMKKFKSVSAHHTRLGGFTVTRGQKYCARVNVTLAGRMIHTSQRGNYAHDLAGISRLTDVSYINDRLRRVRSIKL